MRVVVIVIVIVVVVVIVIQGESKVNSSLRPKTWSLTTFKFPETLCTTSRSGLQEHPQLNMIWSVTTSTTKTTTRTEAPRSANLTITKPNMNSYKNNKNHINNINNSN